MSYKALYREWRPTIFEEILGQGAVTKTIKNQIANEKIGHAYLFSGIRGTGKTSTAKVFARSVNCLQPEDGNPCNKCEICKGIMEERIMDVVEIDAASNNGVDHIRELRDNVKYPPTEAKYKVYIVDEVHMLSQGAFNALLKTLEEPPEYVIFILATTESHKIPATIHSRCQEYEFKRIGYHDILEQLNTIAKALDIRVEEEALRLIINNADGAMRDALSLFDQVISFCGKEITLEEIVNVLGIVNQELLFDLVGSIGNKDTGSTLSIINLLGDSGKDYNIFLKDLIAHYRNLMIYSVTDTTDNLINTSDEIKEQYKTQSKIIGVNAILRAIDLLSGIESQMKWSTQPRVVLEVSLVRLIRPDYEKSMDAMMERIESLEKQLKNGVKVVQNISQKPIAQQGITEQKPVAPAPAQSTKEVSQDDDFDFASSDMFKSGFDDIEEAGYDDYMSSNNEAEKEIKNTAKPQPRQQQVSYEAGQSWEDILQAVKNRKVSTHALLREGTFESEVDNTVNIVFDKKFEALIVHLMSPVNKKILEDAIEEVLGSPKRVNCMVKGSEDKKSDQGHIDILKDFLGDDADKLIIE